jgi:hypothetical protein
VYQWTPDACLLVRSHPDMNVKRQMLLLVQEEVLLMMERAHPQVGLAIMAEVRARGHGYAAVARYRRAESALVALGLSQSDAVITPGPSYMKRTYM